MKQLLASCICRNDISSPFGRLTKDGKIGIVIGPTDDHFEDELWIELADAFLASTEALFEYLKGWTFAKQNPRLVAEMTRGNGL